MRRIIGLVLSVVVFSQVSAGEDLPVREVTVFKDGHAMVLRTGDIATNPDGDVVLTELPSPLLGTFWATSDDPEAALRSVLASRGERPVTRTASTIDEMIDNAAGMTLRLEGDGFSIEGRLVRRTDSGLLVLETAVGLVLRDLGDVRSVTVLDGDPSDALIAYTEPSESLTLSLDWDREEGETTAVSVMYIERGLRWIPSYRVEIVDDDTVRVQLQATLINELVDLDDVRMNLVVGVPSFAFAHTIDPIALQQHVAQLGQYFQRDGRSGAMLSNGLMAQTARMTETYPSGQPQTAPAGSPEVLGGAHNEDLYIYAVDGVTLAKGERLIVPLGMTELRYESMYVLELASAPPIDAYQHMNTTQQRRIAEMLDRPVPRHVLRITNDDDRPLTTAPALIVHDGLPLAQGMMTYTPTGGTSDLEVTSAVAIRVEVEDEELDRDHDAMKWNGNTYARVDATTRIALTNHKPDAVRVEVRKIALGIVNSASDDGESRGINLFTEPALRAGPADAWWRWYGWPWYWNRLNSAAVVKWSVTLEPGEERELTARWHYFWQ